MNYADEIRRQVKAAPCAALPAVTAALWRAYREGKVTEAEAGVLSGLIDGRRLTKTQPRPERNLNKLATFTPQAPYSVKNGSNRAERPRRPGVGSRPRTEASMERRRRWAASGRLPPGIAARFTLAEQAVLALVAAETVRRKDCRLSIENMAAVTGVSRTTVKNAIREAARLSLLIVEERQITGFRDDTNVLRVVSREWLAWLRLARRPLPLEGGVKSVTSTSTEVLNLPEARTAGGSRGPIAGANPPRRATSRSASA